MEAIKSVRALQLQQAMKARNLTRAAMAERMQTSRAQLNRVLDPGAKGGAGLGGGRSLSPPSWGRGTAKRWRGRPRGRLVKGSQRPRRRHDGHGDVVRRAR